MAVLTFLSEPPYSPKSQFLPLHFMELKLRNLSNSVNIVISSIKSPILKLEKERSLHIFSDSNTVFGFLTISFLSRVPLSCGLVKKGINLTIHCSSHKGDYIVSLITFYQTSRTLIVEYSISFCLLLLFLYVSSYMIMWCMHGEISFPI